MRVGMVEAVRVERFTAEYDLVAPLHGIEPQSLRARYDRPGQARQRWYAIDDGRVIGAVLTWLRPDDRMFLLFEVDDVRVYGPLTDRVVEAVGR